MNKKSLILSVLLLIGLLTPQETKPFFGVLLGVSSVVYGITFLNMLTPLNPFRTKNIADYAKEQEDIQSYKALIHIYNTKTKSSLLSIEVVDANPYNLFKRVIQHTSEFEGKKKVTLARPKGRGFIEA